MNYDNVKDYRLQKYFKNAIYKNASVADRVALKTFLNCGTKAHESTGIAILSNSSYSRLSGARMCHNSWACPVCSAVIMSKYATRISAAIDALKEKYVPIMITYTIFHSKSDSCQQAFDVLFETWKRFSSDKKGKRSGVYGHFLHDCEIKHYVRCSEVTYTVNGWHPHLHVLYFVPKHKLHLAAAKEMALRTTWKNAQEKAMLKVYGYTKYNALYESEREHGEGACGVYLSKDNQGNPVIMKTSDYLCGWGIDKELTGNYQKSATCKTSRTPYQLLNAAFDGDQMAIHLYIEFAKYVVTHKRRRVDFSRTGLNQIIAQYMNTEVYKEVLKKKRTKVQEGKAAWRTVIWFSKQDWCEICNNDLPLVFMMLCFAKYDNGFDLIAELLAVNHVKATPLSFDPSGYHDQLAKELTIAA